MQFFNPLHPAASIQNLLFILLLQCYFLDSGPGLIKVSSLYFVPGRGSKSIELILKSFFGDQRIARLKNGFHPLKTAEKVIKKYPLNTFA